MHNGHMTVPPLSSAAWLLALCACGVAHAGTPPRLACALTYAGATQMLEVTPTDAPYTVPSVDVGGRFRFKAVMVGTGALPDYIKTYAYLETRRQPVLVQQVNYYPPFASPPGGLPLTGQHRVYAGPAERELQYTCVLHGGTP